MVLLVLIMKHTQAMRSVDFRRILVLLIFLYGAMFDFTDVTEMDFLACSEIVGKARIEKTSAKDPTRFIFAFSF